MQTPPFLPVLRAAAICVAVGCAASAHGWDAHGHRTITRLALDAMIIAAAGQGADGQPAATLPEWITSDQARSMIAYQSSEADRYRGTRSNYLAHENNPEHYLDVEDLASYGLTLETVPPLRAQYISAMTVARHEHGDDIPPHNPRLNPSGDQEWPGFVVHAIMEHHAKLCSAMKTARTLEKLNEPKREPQLLMARANVLSHMGHLSHFVGDTAQPLHTTKHHHGWVGENPKGYTTERGIHAYIDGTILEIHTLDYASLKPAAKPAATIDPVDPWKDVLAYLQRSHDEVEPLYALKQSGELEQDKGKAFITERLTDAGAMLGALYASAWKLSEPTAKDLEDFVRYDGTLDPEMARLAPAGEAK